jgi:GNAT superfamily N-acetyltransferase
MSVQLAENDNQIADCFAAMKQLRPILVEEEFVTTVRIMMREGYLLAYIVEDERAVCVAGFRIGTNLAFGKNLYVDDLSTLADSRSKGYGAEMMNWLRQYAKSRDCRVLHLDSGVQRFRAHKFYLNQGMAIVSHHFGEQLD